MDIGGSFTDVVTYDARTGRYRAEKVPTTPDDLAAGLLAALKFSVAAPEDISFLVHGTTHGLNTFLQRRGDRVLLLATRGAADVYHIARGPRTRLYDLHYRKPEPLLAPRDIVAVGGRVDSAGAEIEDLDEGAIRAAAQRVKAEGFESVAVAYLFSHLRPDHELRTRELLAEELGPGIPVSLSHEVAQEWREYERTSSAVVDAYIGPAIRRYLSRLDEDLTDQGLRVPLYVMQSSGGITSTDWACRRPMHTLLSGPVGGAIGGAALARAVGRPNLICMDMGGTSFDVSLIVDCRPDQSSEASLEGLPMLMSTVNIHTVGAGGGSVARVEAGGLRVGPASAAASPGPACYGRGGTEPTVTDANLVLGRLGGSRFAGGRLQLRGDLADRALAELGTELGLDARTMAEGICDVANAKMAQAIRTITVARGIEPRDFTLVAFGGAGPMHGAFLARELGIREVLVPNMPGAFSAWGMLQSAVRRDFAEPYFRRDRDLDVQDMVRRLADTGARALDSLGDEDLPGAERRVEHAVDIRYAEQEYTLSVPLSDADEPAGEGFPVLIARRFADLHQARYGHANIGAPIEFTTLRTAVFGDLDRIEPEPTPAVTGDPIPHAVRPVTFDGVLHRTPIHFRDALAHGHAFAGPAIVVEDTATTVVPPGFEVRVDSYGSLVMCMEEK
ncbi:hydantoinase/oxoprolinase family protein [Kitasatospora indigofera]|uniref:hydantoinase/oxoprolinase family protein n=1 Tax=Kitasatospora indigofera TaxID=67307 RepID=UPI0033B656C5